LLVPEIRKFGGKHVLILDGHSSHLSLSAIELCLNNNITMICLPAHSSHILQTLDVGVYGHVKKYGEKYYSNIISIQMLKNQTKKTSRRY
jgi:hypothetical protein